MKKIIILFLSLMIMLIAFAPTAVFAASTTVGDAASLISALNSGYTDITVSGGATITTGSIISIPTGTTITLASGGYYLTLGCTINNNGTIINNNNNLGNNGTINNYGSIVNNEKFYNNSTATITNTGTISNIGTFENSGTIDNSGTITSSGTWTNTGTYKGNAVAVDNPVKLINGSNITYYTTFEAAVAEINNSGYELCLLKDLTIEGNVTMPISGFTLSGAKTGGGVSTLTVNNGDFNTNAAVVLKDIKLAHTGTGGNFNTYYQGVIDTTKYYKTDLTILTGVTFSDIDIVGRSDTLDSSTNTAKGSTLNIQGNADLGSNSILNIANIDISNGGLLKVGSLQTKKLGFNNSGTLDITGTGGLTVTGTLNSNGSGDNTLSLPAPSDHSGTVYSAMLSNTSIGGTSPIKIGPTSGVSFSNKSKLIYLNNTTVADGKFVSGVSEFSAATRTLDSKQYITFINSTNTTLSCAEAAITYGVEGFTLKAAVRDGNNSAVTSGTVKFYKGTSTSGSLLATVGLDSSGNAQYSVNAKDNAAIGDNGFYALYEDSSDYYSQSSGTATVFMNAKSLSISGVNISNKAFDGTTAATITGINLSGIVGTDSVTASAIAVFTAAGAGKNKAVNLSDIKLGGDDAGKYTIASSSADISTTAEITKADPTVQLTASPLTGAVYGDTISLTASVTCASSSTVPSGSVEFYNGSTSLGTATCIDGKAIYTLSNAPLGSYSFSAVYSGDANYNTATGSIDSYIVSKKIQADLTVSGVPAEINYGDSPFALSTAGGTGDGAISYEVTTGTSISVDAATGTVTIVGTGKSVVTASKAGTEIYEPISAEVTVDVAAKRLTISGVSVEDKAYDGTTAATITGINLTGIVGTDNVTVSAVAVFMDPDTGEFKAVDLSDIHLDGSDAGRYTIASTAAAITTKAIISRATPAVQLIAPNTTTVEPGDTVSLAAIVTGAANGAVPTGSVAFFKGDVELGTVACTSGQAIYTWINIPAGTYSIEARYSGDGKYISATDTIAGYTVSKLNQAALTVSGVPSEVHYGDASFTLSATGGSGDGTVGFAIKAGTSLSVAANTGAVTIAGAGDSIITVTKAGTGIYNPVSVDVNVSVEAKSLSISGVSVEDKEYDGTTAAKVTGGMIEGGLVAGDDVTLVTSTAVGQFIDEIIGADKVVTINGYTLGGADAVNYDLKQPLPLTADIQKRNITIKAVEIKCKTYDGTTAAAVTYVTLNRKVDGDDVYVPTAAAIASFSDASVGNGKPVSVTGLALAGVDAGNYVLDSTTASAVGNILPDGDVLPPDFSPVEVSIYSGTKITLIMGTTGASVYYTLDGSVPTVASNKYTVPIPITGDPGTKVTIKALAVKTGMANSGIATKEYTIAKPGTFSIVCEPDNQIVKMSWDAIPEAKTYKVYNGINYLDYGVARPDGKYGFNATGLTNGTQYTFTVQALDSGDCIIKTAQASAIPRTVPGAPTGIAATAGNGQATVSFEAPADNGGSTITEYVVTSSPGSISVKGAGSPITISGLTNGMTYTFTVKAVNAAGNGESSPASNAVTPFSPPGSDSDSDDTTTPAVTPTPAAVTVNIITTPRTENGAPSVTGIVNADAKDDGKGTATAALTESQVEDALNKALTEAAKNGGDTEIGVEIKVTAPAGAKSVEAGIPKAAVDTVAGSKAVAMSVSTPLAEISFDRNSLDTISKAAGDVKISVSKVDTATLSSEAKNTVGDRPVFNFNVSSGDKTISQFGGNVTVSIPYTPKAGEDSNAIVIYYINSEGKPEEVGNCAYDPATGTIRFTTSHFSTYAVGYNKVSFKDVPANALYAKAVGFVAARGITDGTGNGNFSPEAKLTRGQLLVMLMRAYGINPDKAPKDNFADAGNTWYTGYLAAAKRLGISDGIGNNKYAPEKEITRQEMYTLSYNVLKSIGQLSADTSGKTLKGFTDADKVATWAKEAMTFMSNNGIVVENGSRLNPDEKANRAYMAQVLYNLLSK
ncbi:MAG TPA: YDG domain-containing protein [Clostridia bacterium]|nr:YDG domain-containing protein [Clostridia bacterium]